MLPFNAVSYYNVKRLYVAVLDENHVNHSKRPCINFCKILVLVNRLFYIQVERPQNCLCWLQLFRTDFKLCLTKLWATKLPHLALIAFLITEERIKRTAAEMIGGSVQKSKETGILTNNRAKL